MSVFVASQDCRELMATVSDFSRSPCPLGYASVGSAVGIVAQ